MSSFRQNLDELNQLQKEAPQQIGFLWSLMRFLFLVFLVLLLSYVGLAFGYTPFVERQIAKREADIEALSGRVPQAEQEDLLRFYFQIADLQDILKNHVGGSKAFSFLEGKTHSQVFFTSAVLSTAEQRLTLEGIAPSYAAVTEQLQAFDETSEVLRYSLTNTETERAGRVQFGAILYLAPQLFRL